MSGPASAVDGPARAAVVPAVVERASPLLAGAGAFGHLMRDLVVSVFRRGVEPREYARQIVVIGIGSVPIVGLTALFTGMVLALQTAYGLERFGAKNYVGNIAGLGFVRELGPVLTAIVVCGRVGAGVAAEIASMVATEQVDAMRALGADPLRKLVAPRVLAAVTATPLLVVFADVVGIYGGMFVAVTELDIPAYQYWRGIFYTLVIRDVVDGLIKSAVFGLLVVAVACFKGLRTHGGTEGVGGSTTSAVVTGCVIIFAADFFITKLLLLIG